MGDMPEQRSFQLDPRYLLPDGRVRLECLLEGLASSRAFGKPALQEFRMHHFLLQSLHFYAGQWIARQLRSSSLPSRRPPSELAGCASHLYHGKYKLPCQGRMIYQDMKNGTILSRYHALMDMSLEYFELPELGIPRHFGLEIVGRPTTIETFVRDLKSFFPAISVTSLPDGCELWRAAGPRTAPHTWSYAAFDAAEWFVMWREDPTCPSMHKFDLRYRRKTVQDSTPTSIAEPDHQDFERMVRELRLKPFAGYRQP